VKPSPRAVWYGLFVRIDGVFVRAALGMAPPSSQQSAAAAAASARRLSKTPMLKLHWNQVPQERLERWGRVGVGQLHPWNGVEDKRVFFFSSVWSTPRDAPASLGEDEVKQLEALFAAKTAASTAAGGGRSCNETRSQRVLLILR
jgi:hypothetical protein